LCGKGESPNEKSFAAGPLVRAAFLCRYGAATEFSDHLQGWCKYQSKISPGDVHNSFQKLGFFFVNSPRAAGQTGAGLANGTCAWVDRPLNSQEPTILAEDIRAGYQYHVDLDAGKHVVRFRPTNNIYNWVNVLRMPGKLWTFYAYNTNQGELKVVRSYQGTGVPFD
jgi:hypothetical protein